MDLELRHLRLVRAVVSRGSLTKAGDALHLSQSALSHQLQDIEERLGIRLFARVGRRLVLTPAGDLLLRSAHDVLEAIERTETSLRELSGRRGPLRVSVEGYTCYHWLPAVLRRFRVRHPAIEARIDCDATVDPVRALLDGRIDVALVASRGADARLVQQPLFDDALVVAVPRDHPLAHRRSVTKEEVAGELVGDAGAALPTEALVALVTAGVHAAVVSRWVIEPYVRRGGIRAIPLAGAGVRRWMAAVLTDMSRLDYVGDFVDAMVATMGVRTAA